MQWLDPASEQALAFAFRRLPPQLGLLLARRAEPGGELPLGLSRAFPDESLERIAPQPLSLAALYQLVKSRLDLSLPRPVLIRLAEATDGNPFFAIELARAYASRPDEHDLGQPLPVPPSVEEVVAARAGTLSDAARQVALAAASTSHPTPALLAGVLGEETMSAGLIEAEEAGVLTVEDNRLRFSHPLLASVIYRSASQERAGSSTAASRPSSRTPSSGRATSRSARRRRIRRSRPSSRKPRGRQRAEARSGPPPSCSPRRSGSRRATRPRIARAACSPRRPRCSQRETSGRARARGERDRRRADARSSRRGASR